MLLLLTALALSQNPAPFTVQRVRLAPHFETVAPALVMVPRDHWLDLVVTLTAPSIESDVESFEVEAENQSPGYWGHRHGPNIFVKTERLESTGERRHTRSKGCRRLRVWRGINEDIAPLMVAADASVTSETYPQTKEFNGVCVLELPSREAAVSWAAKIARAFRCSQELREFQYDPES